MRVARVTTNETCNQNCGFCNARRPSEKRAFIAPAAVRARIEEAVRGGPGELVLTGGEPTLRRDLEELVSLARRGAQKVTVETNGTLLSEERVDALLEAGVSTFRVHLPAWGETCDRLTRDEGAFARTLALLKALRDRQVAFELATPIAQGNLSAVEELPRRLAEAGVKPRVHLVSVPNDGPDLDALASPDQAARAIERFSEAARTWDLPLRMEQGNPLPPCLLERPGRHAHLYALTPGGAGHRRFVQAEACASCVVRDRCPGLPRRWIEVHGVSPRPITEDRVRRRLTVISTPEEQIARELVTREVRRRPDGVVVPARLVRVNFQCNQTCDFCFVSTHLPSPDERDVVRAIEEAGRVQAILQLTGGEPTLNPRLVEYVRLGYEVGCPEVEIQTNAVRLEDPQLTQALAEAGVTAAFVSLHAPDAELSDRITGVPGTFERTVRGIDELVRNGIAVNLNYVFCTANANSFPDYVAFVGGRWPQVQMTVSVAGAFTDLVPRSTLLIPRYSDIVGPMREGIDRARAMNLTVVGFETMCGMPFCVAPVPDGPAAFLEIGELPPGEGDGEFVKSDACRSCDLERRCFGVRRSYAELYGTDELKAVHLPALA